MENNIHFYAINLRHRTDRWDAFTAQPAIQEIKRSHTLERFDAVPGSTLDIQEDTRISMRTKRNIKESIRRDHEDLNTAGGIGCYLSHVEIWKKIASNQDAYGIVLEDDAKLPIDFLERLEYCIKDISLLPEMPDVWTFSYGYDFFYNTKGRNRPEDIIENRRGDWIYNTCPGGTGGYLVTKEGAVKLLKNAFPIDMHVDLYMCACVDLKTIVCVLNEHLILSTLAESGKSDIQLPTKCTICNIPTNYHQKGNVLINLPVITVTLVAIFGLILIQSYSKGRR